MSCNCKNNIQRRAVGLIRGKTWEQISEIEEGQLNGLYQEQFGKFPTETELRNWLKI